MQSAKNIHNIETLQVKSEVITIDEDEIQSAEIEDLGPQDEPSEIQRNGGTSKLIYYFEPQEKSNLTVTLNDKSKFD